MTRHASRKHQIAAFPAFEKLVPGPRQRPFFFFFFFFFFPRGKIKRLREEYQGDGINVMAGRERRARSFLLRFRYQL